MVMKISHHLLSEHHTVIAIADLAELVEHRTRNAKVTGSILAIGIFSNVKKDKENSKCLFEGNFLKFIFKNNLAFLIFLTKF